MSVKTKMMRLMFGMMNLPTCEEVEQFAYDYLEGQLDPQTTHLVDRHLKACKNCLRFLDSYRKTRGAGLRAEVIPLDPEFKQRLFELLCQQGGLQ